MSAIFSKNCILRGQLDCYCLVCCVYLKSEGDAVVHIQDSKHKQIINSIAYFEPYEQDFIRRVNGIYFCEVCNLTLSTATKVKIHVTEEAHLEGKKGRAMRRAAHGGVVLPCGVAVSEDAWHGLVDDTCVLCNVESVDDTHTRYKPHVLNLISSIVVIGPDGDAYRKVDEFYQCLTCNKVYPEQQLNEHLSSEDHKKGLKNEIETANINEQHNIKKENSADIQMNTGTDTQPDDDSVSSTSKSTIKEKNKEIPKFLQKFIKEHGLLLKDDNSVYCDICSTQILATLDAIKEHLYNSKHTVNKGHNSNTKTQAKNTEKATKNREPSIQKVMFDEYVTSMQIVFADKSAYFIINESICIDVNSYMGINEINNKFNCHICDIDLTEVTVPLHVYTEQHKYSHSNSYVITSLKDELVRQINSDKYYCGYCCNIEKNIGDILDHLTTAGHIKCKTEHQEKLKKFNVLIPQGLIPHINLNNFTALDVDMLRNIGLLDNLKI